jgi:lipoate-protein ligase A
LPAILFGVRPLFVLRDPPLDGPTNMARDEHLLHSEELRPAAVRIYYWSPATLSLGYFQKHAAVASLPADVRGLAVVRRPTGGGAILHDREITYCIAVDESMPIAHRPPAALYRLAHDCWRAVVAADEPAVEMAPDSLAFPSPRSGPFFCFQQPGQTDLTLGGAKVLGSAQRRVRGRVLQHGSLILGRRFASHPGAHLNDPPGETCERWIRGFVAGVARALELDERPVVWTDEQLADVAVRREKYAGEQWTRLR